MIFFTYYNTFVKKKLKSLRMGKNRTWDINRLPLDIDVESKLVLKSLPRAHAALAELKGIASTIPNQNILINT